MKATERQDLSTIADDLREIKTHIVNGSRDSGITAPRAAELGARLEQVSQALDGMIVSGTPAVDLPAVDDEADSGNEA